MGRCVAGGSWIAWTAVGQSLWAFLLRPLTSVCVHAGPVRRGTVPLGPRWSPPGERHSPSPVSPRPSSLACALPCAGSRAQLGETAPLTAHSMLMSGAFDGMVTASPFLHLDVMTILTGGCCLFWLGRPGAKLMVSLQPDQSAARFGGRGWSVNRMTGSGSKLTGGRAGWLALHGACACIYSWLLNTSDAQPRLVFASSTHRSS